MRKFKCIILHVFEWQQKQHHTRLHSKKNNYKLECGLLEFASENVGQLVHCGIRDGLSNCLINLLSHVGRQLRMGLLELLGADAAAHSRDASVCVCQGSVLEMECSFGCKKLVNQC